MSNMKNLKQAIIPIIWLNCIFCMGIFEIPINHPRYFLSAFYVISILTGYFIMFYTGSHVFIKILIQAFNIFHYVLGVSLSVAVLAIILFWWKKSENMNNIIRRIAIVDNTLEELGIKKEYQKTFRKILYQIAIWIVGVLTLTTEYELWFSRDIGYWAAFYSTICTCFPFIVNSVVGLTFASFIKCVQIKFWKINILLNNIVLGANESNTFKIPNRHNTSMVFVIPNYQNKDKVIHHIQTLRHLHLEITRIGRQINRTYCLQLLLQLAVNFAIITSNIYYIYRIFAGQFVVTDYNEKILPMAISVVIYTFKILLINWLCSSVSTEAYKTSAIIQSLEGSIIDDDVREEIHQFSHQIMLNSLNFTAAGFFTIDHTLTGKFFATVTTYVIILIQMNTSHTMT